MYSWSKCENFPESETYWISKLWRESFLTELTENACPVVAMLAWAVLWQLPRLIIVLWAFQVKTLRNSEVCLANFVLFLGKFLSCQAGCNSAKLNLISFEKITSPVHVVESNVTSSLAKIHPWQFALASTTIPAGTWIGSALSLIRRRGDWLEHLRSREEILQGHNSSFMF